MVLERNPNAVVTLRDRYKDLLHNIAFKIIHNWECAEEVESQVWSYYWEEPSNYDPKKGKLLGWLVMLTRRRAIDQTRQRDSYSRALDRFELVPTEEYTHVEQDVHNQEWMTQFLENLEQLPSLQAEAVFLAITEGLSQAEISKAMGSPLGTTKTRLELGFRKLKPLYIDQQKLDIAHDGHRTILDMPAACRTPQPPPKDP